MAARKKTWFAKALVPVLKSYFPRLGTNFETGGAETVEALFDLYEWAKKGGPISGAPEEPIRLSNSDWAEIYAALRWKMSSPATVGNKRWLNQLSRIMETIGPDGDTAFQYGVAPKGGKE